MNFIGKYMPSLNFKQSLKLYWAKSSGIRSIKECYNRLSQLSQASLKELFTHQVLAQPSHVFFNPEDANQDSFLNLLYYGGYLTVAYTVSEDNKTQNVL